MFNVSLVLVPDALSPHTRQYSTGWARLMSPPLPRSLSTDTASVTNYQKKQNVFTLYDPLSFLKTLLSKYICIYSALKVCFIFRMLVLESNTLLHCHCNTLHFITYLFLVIFIRRNIVRRRALNPITNHRLIWLRWSAIRAIGMWGCQWNNHFFSSQFHSRFKFLQRLELPNAVSMHFRAGANEWRHGLI